VLAYDSYIMVPQMSRTNKYWNTALLGVFIGILITNV
jgi:hypothetical protein